MPDSQRILIYRYLRAFSEYKTTQLAGRDGQHTHRRDVDDTPKNKYNSVSRGDAE
ncbi:MAG: hypothetical protein L3J82_03160 [Planctomycetes bacterium]|nr:hypothetical protein [Planctomycetota bacterium]